MREPEGNKNSGLLGAEGKTFSQALRAVTGHNYEDPRAGMLMKVPLVEAWRVFDHFISTMTCEF